jgi:hypothetical protein
MKESKICTPITTAAEERKEQRQNRASSCETAGGGDAGRRLPTRQTKHTHTHTIKKKARREGFV